MPRRPMTEEEKQAARERLAKGREKAAANRAQAPTEAPPAPKGDDPLMDLAALIVRATKQDENDAEIVRQFTSLIERIDFKKHPELRDHPAMQGLIQKAFDAEEIPADMSLPPGTVVGTGLAAQAIPWTWEHVKRLHDAECDCGGDPERSCNPRAMYRMDRITPEKTMPVIINGLQVWFAEGIETRWYKPWIDQYRATQRAAQEAARHAQWLFKVGDWGPNVPPALQPAPNPDWLEDEGAFQTRASGEGMYAPGRGWNPAVDGRRNTIPEGAEPAAEPEPAAA